MAKENKQHVENVNETPAEKQARIDAFQLEKKMEQAEAAGFPIITEADFVNLDDSEKALTEIFARTEQGIMSTHASYRVLQVAAIDILRHVEKFHDTTVVDRFITEIDDAYLPSDKMMLFIAKFSPLVYVAKDKVWKFDPKSKNTYDIKHACEKPWYKLGGKSKPTPFNIYAALAQFLKSAENHTLNAKDNDVTDEVLLAKLAKIGKEYQVDKALKPVETVNSEETASVEKVKVA